MKTENTIKTMIRLPEELVEEIDRTLENANCKYRSDFIRKAIYFYLSYINSNDKANGYLSEVMQQYLDARLSVMEDSFNKLFFKEIVEVGILSQMIAFYNNVHPSVLENMRKKVTYEVKATNGKIDIEDALEFQNNINKD
jgi:Arc/MetJ-type ribon-helix-helix transcriptional regulator